MSNLLEALYEELRDERSKERLDTAKRRNNESWIRDSFFTKRSNMSKEARDWSFHSTADTKYVDSSWGGNFSVNSRAQWTPLSDPRRIGSLTGRKSMFRDADPIKDIRNLGMGRAYSEHVDDNVQRVYFRFGVPQYNSLINFLDKMSSSEAVRMATTGSSFNLTRIVGEIITWPYVTARAPIAGVLMIFTSITAKLFGSKILNGSNQFYALKSVQGVYWNTVQSLVNEFLTATNVLQYEGWNKNVESTFKWIGSPDAASRKRADAAEAARKNIVIQGESGEAKDSQVNNLKEVAKLMPDVFDEDYGFNVVKVMQKTMRRSTRYLNSMESLYSKDDLGIVRTYAESVQIAIANRAKGEVENTLTLVSVKSEDNDIAEVVKDAMKSPIKTVFHAYELLVAAVATTLYNKSDSKDLAASADPLPEDTEGDGFFRRIINSFTDSITDATKDAIASKSAQRAAIDKEAAIAQGQRAAGDVSGQAASEDFNDIVDFMDLSMKYGAEFVAFDVSYTGTVEESVSNNVQPSPLGEMMRSIAGSARTLRNVTANGNIGDGVAASLAEGTISLISGLATGAANLVTFQFADNLLDILQGAQVDMPQFWESSNMTLPTASYTLQLRSSGGDMLSQLRGIYLPLFCIIAGSFPQAVGESAHVHPFYCQLFDKGKVMRDCGMITRITVARGVGNLGYDQNWRALAIDVTIEVTDLAPILAVPALPGLLVPGHPMTNYIWTLSSIELDMKLHGMTILSKSLERISRRTNTIFDKANIANSVMGYAKGSAARWFINPQAALGFPSAGMSDGLGI